MTNLHMTSRRTRLRPPNRALIERLFDGAMTGEFPWLTRNVAVTPQNIEEALWSNVLAQFAIEERRAGTQIALVSAHNANHFHRFAYVSLTLLPEYKRRVWPFEGVLLFGHYIFTKFDLLNIYAETTSSLYEEFQSGAGRLFTEVGRFPERLMVNGVREDLVVTGMSRNQWDAEGVPLLNRCLPGDGAGPQRQF